MSDHLERDGIDCPDGPRRSPEEVIRRKHSELSPYLNERTRRMWAATEAHELGFGGVSIAWPGRLH